MSILIQQPPLNGHKALVVGIANEHSLAWGCAQAFRELSAELAITYLNEKARPYVKPLAESAQASIFMPINVSAPGEMEGVFARIEQLWGSLVIVGRPAASVRNSSDSADSANGPVPIRPFSD